MPPSLTGSSARNRRGGHLYVAQHSRTRSPLPHGHSRVLRSYAVLRCCPSGRSTDATPPNGLATLARLCASGCGVAVSTAEVWPILIAAGLAGFVLYDLQTGLPVRSIISLILADTIEILIAALGVSYSLKGVPRLSSLNALSNYLFFAVILAPISAAMQAGMACAANRNQVLL
jgi:hypothetical protein